MTWHWLRHANAILLDAVGTPLGTVQALLGHSSSAITRDVYLHWIPSDARAAVQKIVDFLIGPKWTQVVQIPKMRSYLIQCVLMAISHDRVFGDFLNCSLFLFHWSQSEYLHRLYCPEFFSPDFEHCLECLE